MQATSNLSLTRPADHKPINFRVIHQKVAIRPDVAEEYSTGAAGAKIALPTNTVDEQAPIFGTVVAVGDGRFNMRTGEYVPLPVKVGDRVAFEKYVGNLIEIDGEPIKIIDDGHVLAILGK